MGDMYADFQVVQHDRVIYVKVEGSIDLESMTDCINKVEDIIPHIQSPWASFVDLSNWQLHTPETISLLGEFENRMMDEGMSVEVSMVGKSEFIKSAREQLFQQSNVGVEQVYVDTIEEGWTWLIQNEYCGARPDEKN